MIKILPQIEVASLPIIKSNLSLLKDEVKNFLKKYDFIVSEDGIKDAKAKATELNKMASTLDSLRKERVKEISAPIREFDNEAKEIYGMIKETRESLLSQIKKFEEETKQKLEEILSNELKALFELHGVEPEFQKAQFVDLVKISNLTKGGRLTKKASDELLKRVLANKELQEKIKSRLMTLEGESLKAGLETPLRRHNVQHFLYTDDYEEKLQELINAELQRQEETKLRLQKQLEMQKQKELEAKRREEQKQKELEKKALEAQIAQQVKEATMPNAATNTPANNIKTRYKIVVEMELETVDMEVAKLEKATYQRFLECDFKSVKSIKVNKLPNMSVVNSKNTLIAEGSLF